ncbi:uncharacterized protein NPIL_670171, partial [Nephila pilipes]
KQEAEPSKSPKMEPKVPPRTHQNHQRWPSAAENSCPDILKNGHNYVKDGCNSTTSEIDVNTTDISRNSLLNERVPADSTLFIPPSPLIADDPLLKPGGAATMALGVSAVDLTSGKTKTIVIHPPHKHHEGTANQSSLVTLDGHFL